MTYLVGYIRMLVTYTEVVVVKILVGIHRREPRAGWDAWYLRPWHPQGAMPFK
jgi:hypothetical protein